MYRARVASFRSSLVSAIAIAIAAFAVIGAFSPQRLLAEESPAAFVERIISTMKSEKNAAAVVEFIHWPSAYAAIPADQLKSMEVNSPEALKTYLDGMLRSPSTAMRAMMSKRVQAMGPDGQAAAEAAMSGMVAEVEKQEKDLVGKIERANYSIGKVVEKEDSAEVELTTELDGQKRTDTVHLKKIDGQWYLPTVNSMGDTNTQIGQ